MIGCVSASRCWIFWRSLSSWMRSFLFAACRSTSSLLTPKSVAFAFFSDSSSSEIYRQRIHKEAVSMSGSSVLHEANR